MTVFKKQANKICDLIADAPAPSKSVYIRWAVWTVFYTLVSNKIKTGDFWTVLGSSAQLFLLACFMFPAVYICSDRTYVKALIAQRKMKAYLLLLMYFPIIMFFGMDCIVELTGEILTPYFSIINTEFWVKESTCIIFWIMSIPTIAFYKLLPWIINIIANVLFAGGYFYMLKTGMESLDIGGRMLYFCIAGIMTPVIVLSIIAIQYRLSA